MAQSVTMPALGESVTEGTITNWLKKVGDQVQADEPLVEVSTDKVDSEVPAPLSGVVLQILVQEDETVEVGTPIAVIGSPNEAAAPAPEPAGTAPAAQAPAAPAPEPPAPAAPETHAPAPAHAAPAPPAPGPAGTAPAAPAPAAQPESAAPEPPAAPLPSTDGGYVTPLVRKLARERGIDLSRVPGTGVGGRIRREDVLEAARKAEEERKAEEARRQTEAPQARPAVPPDAAALRGSTQKLTHLRQTIARRMQESLQNSAQLTTVVEVDVSRIVALRARAKDAFARREGTKLTYLPFFVKAATEALQQHPTVNARLDGREVTYYDHEDVGIAVDTPRGLLVPVVRRAGALSLAGIAHAINDLAERTRRGTVSPDELTGSTFTITNTGSVGALFDTPILNAPETGILGVGAIVKRPVVVSEALGSDAIAIRSMVYLALSYDHRLLDGADAGRFLGTIKRRLEAGEFGGELGL